MAAKRKRTEDLDPQPNDSTTCSAEESPGKKARTGCEVLLIEPSSPVPLTEANLALLEGDMPSNVKSIDSYDSANAKDPNYVREKLEFHGILFNDADALATPKGKSIFKTAKDLVAGDRLSPPSHKMLKEFVLTLQEEQGSNEATFMDVMWHILVAKRRSVKAKHYDPAAEDDDVLRRRWKDDHLRHRVDQEFVRGYLPGLDPDGEATLAKLLAKHIGMKNPKPDLVYGLAQDAFKEVGTIANSGHRDLAQISPGIYHPFFIIEFKSHKGDLMDAMNQASRGGAVLTNSMNILKQNAGIRESADEYDLGSFAFSLVLDPFSAKTYVHWRELRVKNEKSIMYHHMHFIDGYILESKESVDKLRVAVNNILDWGVGERRTWLLEMLAQLETRYQETASTKSSAGSSAGSTKDIGKGKGKASDKASEKASSSGKS
ncbi:MAG: hypothetical protein Q9195_004895 [Heterodermia aff. obscurata]